MSESGFLRTRFKKKQLSDSKTSWSDPFSYVLIFLVVLVPIVMVVLFLRDTDRVASNDVNTQLLEQFRWTISMVLTLVTVLVAFGWVQTNRSHERDIAQLKDLQTEIESNAEAFLVDVKLRLQDTNKEVEESKELAEASKIMAEESKELAGASKGLMDAHNQSVMRLANTLMLRSTNPTQAADALLLANAGIFGPMKDQVLSSSGLSFIYLLRSLEAPWNIPATYRRELQSVISHINSFDHAVGDTLTYLESKIQYFGYSPDEQSSNET